MKAAAVSAQGKRPGMEDAHFLDSDFGGKGWTYGGIYDGHGGSFAANYAARFLHQRFIDLVLHGAAPEAAFEAAYESVSDELKAQDSGTTAVDFLIGEGDIVTANAGDARAVLVSRRTVEPLSADHRLDNEIERQRVERMGGRIVYPYVYRGLSGLMPTRTIGDQYFKPVGVIATPAVSRHHIEDDDLMLVASCDGLFDFMCNDDVAEFARNLSEPTTLAETLKSEVLDNRGGSDNITIICVLLH